MARGRAAAKRIKPTIFIASSAESKPVAAELQRSLSHDFIAKPWWAGTIQGSEYPLIALEDPLDRSQFAVFVFGTDDKVISRGRAHDGVRDNVLIELGLFIGRLGRERCFIVAPKGTHKLKIPSDLHGFTPVYYDSEVFDQDKGAAIASAVTEIHDQAQKVLMKVAAEAPMPPPDGRTAQPERDSVNEVFAVSVADVLTTFRDR